MDFSCIEVPALVKRLREQFAGKIAAKEKTIIPGEDVTVDFTTGTVGWRRESFAFPPLGSVPQSLVIAGGAENVVAKKLGLNVEDRAASSCRVRRLVMAKHTVVTMPGDGIGNQVLPRGIAPAESGGVRCRLHTCRYWLGMLAAQGQRSAAKHD